MRAALADAAWGFGGEKGQRTALPSLPLPASVGSSWPAVPGAYSLLVSRSCWHLRAHRRFTRFSKLL